MFAYESLILLQLPLHLLVLMLKGKNTGPSLLTLTIFGLTFHSWLFIEIQLNEFTLVKLDKTVNPAKSTFLKIKTFYYTILFFFIKYLWMPTISSTSVTW